MDKEILEKVRGFAIKREDSQEYDYDEMAERYDMNF